MRISLTAFVLVTVTASLFAAEPEPIPKGEQGVTGKVIKLIGNFQPKVTIEGVPLPPDNGKRNGLKVPVHVFKGKVEPFEKPNPKHPQLVIIAKPDKTGTFRVPLEPGEYTVVAEIDGKLYLNLVTFDAETKQTAWGTVEVKAKEWTTSNIEDTSQAAF